LYGDARKDLNETWPRLCKFQPIWKVRNYFGEEIALYFAWVGILMTTLIIPTLFGMAVTGYGMFVR